MYSADEVLTKLRIWKGESRELQLGIDQDLFLTLPRGEHDRLVTILDTEEPNIAPVAKGAARGTIRVRLDNELLVERPLVAMHPIEVGSLWQRFGDSIRLLFQ